ncbi:MAG: oxygen-independent coproporphyrinogen III oxidase [Parasphingorhabdus sp.]|uniref:oxygen-independent coproporphyrinogen III oxidase n=1 Tax=Parasphingorhabdus sp. TaxID=2709688 RepID=UPI003299D832
MWKYYPELLERPVPRYTSYPTAADFNADIGSRQLEQALADVRLCDEISLYAHIPYCDQICWYCGCNTGRANRTHRLTAYLQALFAEIDLVASRLNQRGRVKRIAFGGGSPNALSASDFKALMSHLQTDFRVDDAVLSIELDPRSYSAEWRDMMAEVTMDNVSLGIQSFDPSVQAAIGRVQPLDMVTDMVVHLRGQGVTSLNFDLMYGLPGQTIDILKATLEQTVRLLPERIALFGYAHIPSLIPRQRQIDDSNLPDARQRFDMAAFGHDFLTQAGYQPVGFDHFALLSDPLGQASAQDVVRRNFQGFTDDQSRILIGMGASAISEFPNLIVQNEKNTGRYRGILEKGKLPAVLGIERSSSNQRHGAIIEQILSNGLADLSPLGGAAAHATSLVPYINRGLVEITDEQIKLHESAKPYARSIAATFDEFRGQTVGTFSQAV